MTQTHTPGPWTVIPAQEYDGDDGELEGSYTSPAGIEGANGDPVCVFGSAEGSGCLFENDADYALIAAAPDMLEALKKANQFIRNGIELGYIQMPDVETPDSAHDTPPMIRDAIAKAEGRP